MDDIILDVQPAGVLPVVKMIARRIAARIIDILVLWAIGWVALWSLPLERMGDHGWVIGFVIVILYDSFSHSKYGGGATVGKWILGLKVVDEFGVGLTWRRALLRALPFAIPMVAGSIGLELRTMLPSSLGNAANQAMLGLLIGWIIGAPILMAVTSPSRSYCDLFGRTICLSRRMLALLGLPRLGVQLFAHTVKDEAGRKNLNLFTARSALVHFLWAIPLLVFAITGTFHQPLKYNGSDTQNQLRHVISEIKLPVSGLVVQRADDKTDSILVQARITSGLSGRQFGQREIEAVSFALWSEAIKLVPTSISPDHLIVELRSGPDLGFTSHILINAKSSASRHEEQEQASGNDSTIVKPDSGRH